MASAAHARMQRSYTNKQTKRESRAVITLLCCSEDFVSFKLFTQQSRLLVGCWVVDRFSCFWVLIQHPALRISSFKCFLKFSLVLLLLLAALDPALLILQLYSLEDPLTQHPLYILGGISSRLASVFLTSIAILILSVSQARAINLKVGL